jgi:hypothetical protein
VAGDIKSLRQIVLFEHFQETMDILLAGLQTTGNVADGVFAAIGADPARDSIDVNAIADLNFLAHDEIIFLFLFVFFFWRD